MSDMSVTPFDEAKPQLKFHVGFKTPSPGSIILQSDDETKLCFYFSQSLLSGVSPNFFGSLPTPSPSDLIDDTPLIPLIGASTWGLYYFLTAIKSLTSCSPPIHIQLNNSKDALRRVMDAAVIGKMYLTPVIFRLLQEALDYHGHSTRHPLLMFGVWALSDDGVRIQRAAKATLGHNVSFAPKAITEPLHRHAPEMWPQLVHLHLRYAEGASVFQQHLGWRRFAVCQRCEASGSNSSDAIHQRYLKAANTKELLAAVADFELQCEDCDEIAQEFYGSKIYWFYRFTTDLILSEEFQEFPGR